MEVECGVIAMKCERCDKPMTETIEQSQVQGRWRRKMECPQCHGRKYSFLEEAETIETEERHSLQCERCHDKTTVLYLAGASDHRMVCVRCKCEMEEEKLDAQYRSACSY